MVETRVEQKITIQSDGDPIDHDRALAEAIQVRARARCGSEAAGADRTALYRNTKQQLAVLSHGT